MPGLGGLTSVPEVPREAKVLAASVPDAKGGRDAVDFAAARVSANVEDVPLAGMTMFFFFFFCLMVFH